MKRSMQAASLHRVLCRALVIGAPFGTLACSLSTSSCPDDGVEPPPANMMTIGAGDFGGGPLSAAQCEELCDLLDTGVITCVRTSPEAVLCITQPSPCEGRRPAGLRSDARSARTGVQRYLAECARLEAASIEAFRVLRRELAAHRAPRRLLRAASRAARDERRHARIADALARRFGAAPGPVTVEPRPVRSLEAIARENAVEGCVRETWGALVALRQSRLATAAPVRAAMRRIARDEVRHAELAWAVDAWLRPRLGRAAGKRVHDARAAAVAELSREVTHVLPAQARERLGVPCATESLALVAELERALWLAG
jgi:hypothetical protein